MTFASRVGLCLCFVVAQVGGAILPAVGPDATRLAPVSWTVRQSTTVCYKGIAPFAFYTLRGFVSAGGYGAVFWLVDKRGYTWATKEVDATHSQDKAQNELEVYHHTRHAPFNMVLHEVYSTAERMSYVMPMLPHGSLEQFVADRAQLFSKSWRSISAQIAFGLWELHQRGVIHRDLKTGNIMILDEAGDNITLIDYNQATTGCRDKRGKACDVRPSMGGFKKWAQVMINPYSYEIDWWSFGVLLHNFSLGELPWQGSGSGWRHPHRPGFLKMSRLKGEDPSLVSILNATIGFGYISLKAPERRRAMESPLPEVHPVLSNDFWLAGVNFTPATRMTALREYWSGVCKSHAADPEVQCALLFKEKPAEKRAELCDSTVVAKCCCRQSACKRNKSGDINASGVDGERVVEGGNATTTWCCARMLECGAKYPHANTTFGSNASCFELHA